MHSAIYTGRLRHRRFFPKRHEFCYSSTLFYLDLDELPELFSDTFFWSINSKNLGAFQRADYLGDPQFQLIDAVRNKARELAGYCPSGPVRMLTNLRIFGLCFNPVTFYYLFNANNTMPELILAEVNNTPWNERHVYLVRCNSSGKTASTFAKEFHVSPFNPLAMEYRWVSTAPGESLLVHMENHGAMAEPATQGLHMDATLTLERQPWSSAALNKILLLQPWAAIKVPVLIYWQALRLFIKGAPLYDHAKFITTGENP
jgi:DUF1365 family protein